MRSEQRVAGDGRIGLRASRSRRRPSNRKVVGAEEAVVGQMGIICVLCVCYLRNKNRSDLYSVPSKGPYC